MKFGRAQLTAPMYTLLGWLDEQRPPRYTLDILKERSKFAPTAWNVHVAWCRRGWVFHRNPEEAGAKEEFEITQAGSDVAAEWREASQRKDPRLVPLIALVDMIPLAVTDEQLLQINVTVVGEKQPPWNTLLRAGELRVARRLLSGEG